MGCSLFALGLSDWNWTSRSIADLHMANGLEVLFIGFFVSVTAPTWVLLVGFTVSAPISAACQQVVEEASDDQE